MKKEKKDLLYTNKKTKTKKASLTNGKQKKKVKDVINLDNEIIIGVTEKKKEPQKNKAEVKKSKKVKKSIKNNDKKSSKDIKRSNNTKVHKNVKKKARIKILKWTCLGILLITAILLFLLSDVFNIKDIKVINNSKLSENEIVSLSGLTLEKNMFSFRKGQVKDNIKKNAYVEDVKISRSLQGVITLDVKERVATYMLEYGNAYVYINNQGYILEIAEEKIDVPIIKGFQTKNEDLVEGNRLAQQDLEKLEVVLKIIESAKSNNIANLITSVDITEETNYIIEIASESKKVHFGNESSITEKVLWIVDLLEREKGKAGEMFIKLENSNRVYFRESVK